MAIKGPRTDVEHRTRSLLTTDGKATPPASATEGPATIGRHATRLGDVVVPSAFPIALAASVITALILLYASRRLSFTLDEWDFILHRYHPSAQALLSGHNGHWSTLLVVVYQALLHTIGLRSYLPYMAVLELLHAGSALLLFLLVRRRAGDIPALVVLCLFLLFGPGSTDVFFAFQIGFVGSVCFGLLAMVLLDRSNLSIHRVIGASLALLASVMFSGVGLVFLAGLCVELLLTRERRRHVLALLGPLIAFAWWYAAWGRLGTGHTVVSLDATGRARFARFLGTGLYAAAARTFSIPDRWGGAPSARPSSRG